jgi:hypothetical protein
MHTKTEAKQAHENVWSVCAIAAVNRLKQSLVCQSHMMIKITKPDSTPTQNKIRILQFVSQAK